MFRITESEKPKLILLVTFVRGCVFFGACVKQRRHQQRMAGKATLLRSTGNYPRFSQDGFDAALLANQHAVVQMHDAIRAASKLQVVGDHDEAGVL